MKYITFSVLVLLVSVVAVLHVGGDETSQQPATAQFPIGKNVGPVEFDCVIELAAPVTKERHIFFMRYQVSPKTISYDIHWAEPAWHRVNFPYPPFGLSMYADDSQFVIYSAWNDRRWDHTLPSECPGVFNFTCGNYPIDEKRHFFSESLLTRLFAEDISTIAVRRRSTPLNNSELRRGLRVDSFATRPDYMQFGLGFTHSGYKALVYYSIDNRLKRLIAGFRERTIPISGFEIEVISNDFPDGIKITQLPAKYHDGGRTCEVFFTESEINSKQLILPISISVKNTKKCVQ
jgi:hypothetical protein